MARITCEPCEIIPVCNCCHEILCHCGKNKVFQCVDPCFPVDEANFPGGAPLPYFIEGMVADPNILGFSNNAVVGPPLSSITLSGWDTRYNLFDYQFTVQPSTLLNPYASYTNDLSDCQLGANTMVPNSYFSNNENLKPQINSVVNRLLNKTSVNFTGYIPCGVAGGPILPQGYSPYNEIDYFLFRGGNIVEDSLSDTLLEDLALIGRKSVTSSRFAAKYKKAIAKSILFGYFETYFYGGKFDLIRQFSEKAFRTKSIPTVLERPRFAGQYTLDPTSVPVANLENIKTYVRENRIRFHSGRSAQRLSNKILKQYWKFIPSDINLRVRLHRTPEVVRWIFNHGPVVTATYTGASSIASVRVNDDDTVSVHRISPNAGKVARTHYINAEHLRVFNNSGGYVYLDGTPRYQTGCACCTSGCFITLCSDRDRSYVFDTMDRSALLGLAGAVSGFDTSGFDSDPYIKLSISAPFSSEVEFWSPYGPQANKDFYLLSPQLSANDILSATVAPNNSLVKTTLLEYKVVTTGKEGQHPQKTLNSQKLIDRAIRFKSGPGNVLYISNDDPIFSYLNYLDSYEGRALTASAEIPDLNLSGILDGTERYPRRIPAHILIIPTDQPIQNPLYGKSLITKMEDSSEGDGIIRTIKMVPAPTEDVFERTYIDLVENKNATLQNGYLPYGYGESDKLPFGPQGTALTPLKMQFTASNIYESFNNWQAGVEGSRRIDPVRKVFDFLTSATTYYDTRADVTYVYGVYPSPRSDGWNLVYDPTYPVLGAGIWHQCLPLFDIWRYLTKYEFHEFVSSFNNKFFQKLMSGKYRDVQLFHMTTRWPEKTHIHTFVPPFGIPWWTNKPQAGSPDPQPYLGSIENPRCCSGIYIGRTLEGGFFMDTAEERSC